MNVYFPFGYVTSSQNNANLESATKYPFVGDWHLMAEDEKMQPSFDKSAISEIFY